jgi:hypothetical protein
MYFELFKYFHSYYVTRPRADVNSPYIPRFSVDGILLPDNAGSIISGANGSTYIYDNPNNNPGCIIAVSFGIGNNAIQVNAENYFLEMAADPLTVDYFTVNTSDFNNFRDNVLMYDTFDFLTGYGKTEYNLESYVNPRTAHKEIVKIENLKLILDGFKGLSFYQNPNSLTQFEFKFINK